MKNKEHKLFPQHVGKCSGNMLSSLSQEGDGNSKVTKYTASEEERSGKPRKSNSKNRSGEDILPRTEGPRPSPEFR